MKQRLTTAANHPALLVSGFLIAFWPVWTWYVARLTDGSDEPWGLVALITALFFLARTHAPRRQPQVSLVLIGLVFYASASLWLSQLVSAILAIGVLGYILSCLRMGKAFHMGLWGLLWLSLPLLASLQFYLGYPLRMLTAMLAAPLLQLSGFAVVASGAALDWQGMLISVDAPCSGIRMLWMALYLTFSLSCWLQLSNRYALLLSVGAIALVVVANTWRAAALFYMESDVFVVPSWMHEGTGIVVFMALAITLVTGTHGLARLEAVRRGGP